MSALQRENWPAFKTALDDALGSAGYRLDGPVARYESMPHFFYTLHLRLTDLAHNAYFALLVARALDEERTRIGGVDTVFAYYDVDLTVGCVIVKAKYYMRNVDESLP